MMPITPVQINKAYTLPRYAMACFTHCGRDILDEHREGCLNVFHFFLRLPSLALPSLPYLPLSLSSSFSSLLLFCLLFLPFSPFFHFLLSIIFPLSLPSSPPLSRLRLPSSLSFVLPTHPPVPLSLPFRTPSLSSLSSNSSPLAPYHLTTPPDCIFFYNPNRHHKDPIRSDQNRSDPIRSNLAYPRPRLCLRETDLLRQIDGERCCYVS